MIIYLHFFPSVAAMFCVVHQVSAVSTIVNRGLPLKAYVFRNYRLMPGVRSHYLGDCKHKMWQAIRASSAAPGYFQEFVLGKDLHQVRLSGPTHRKPSGVRGSDGK